MAKDLMFGDPFFMPVDDGYNDHRLDLDGGWGEFATLDDAAQSLRAAQTGDLTEDGEMSTVPGMVYWCVPVCRVVGGQYRLPTPLEMMAAAGAACPE